MLKTVSALFLIVLGAACGSEPASPAPTGGAPTASATPPAATRDACTLITADEAGKILGSAAKASPRSAGANRSGCDYVTEAYESFTLEVVSSGAAGHLKTAISGGKIAASQAGGQDQVVNDVIGLNRVDNLGDEAYFSRRAMSYVRKGDVLLVFRNAGLNEPAREHWEALARAALARL